MAPRQPDLYNFDGARRGAQRGLGFVAREAADWQQRNQCYGCHVQAVTLEALSIGLHNQYEVPKADLATIASGLTTDKDGRIYAATSVGIQVFDPTGRLCGVITAPGPGAEHLRFEGDQLTAWVGETKYARKLKTTGVK